MVDIRFIKDITAHNVRRHGIVLGNAIYYELESGLLAKAYCEETAAVAVIINPKQGEVDRVELPFRNYFDPAQCSDGAPLWYQHVTKMNGEPRWNFEKEYPHLAPKEADFRRLANAIQDYIDLFEAATF